MVRILNILFLSILTIYLVGGCKPEEEKAPDISLETQAAKDDGYMMVVVNDLLTTAFAYQSIYFDSIFNPPVADTSAPDSSLTDTTDVPAQNYCPIVTINYFDSVNWPKVINIDYGIGCQSSKLNIYTNKLRVEFSGWYTMDEVDSILVTLENFTLNGALVNGSLLLSKTFEPTDSSEAYIVRTRDFSLYINDTLTIEKSGTLVYEMQNNNFASRAFLGDDVFGITGEMEGTWSANKSYTYTIIEPLEWSFTCPFVSRGEAELTTQIEEEVTIPVKYGFGLCDNIGEVSVDGNTRDFLMEYEYRQLEPVE